MFLNEWLGLNLPFLPIHRRKCSQNEAYSWNVDHLVCSEKQMLAKPGKRPQLVILQWIQHLLISLCGRPPIGLSRMIRRWRRLAKPLGWALCTHCSRLSDRDCSYFGGTQWAKVVGGLRSGHLSHLTTPSWQFIQGAQLLPWWAHCLDFHRHGPLHCCSQHFDPSEGTCHHPFLVYI